MKEVYKSASKGWFDATPYSWEVNVWEYTPSYGPVERQTDSTFLLYNHNGSFEISAKEAEELISELQTFISKAEEAEKVAQAR